MNWNILYIYPFHIGSMLTYGVIFGDTIYFNSWNVTMTFLLHFVGEITCFIIYWNNEMELTHHDIQNYIAFAMATYYSWCIIYYLIMVLLINHRNCVIRDKLDHDTDTRITRQQIIEYIVRHFIGTHFNYVFGMIIMQCYYLSLFAIGIQVLVALYNGNRIYEKYCVI